MAGVLVACQVGKAAAALSALRADLSLSLVIAGWVISIFNLLTGLLGVLAGVAGDWLGHRRMILLGLALVSLASLVGAAADGPVLLLSTRFVEGIGFILVVVAAPGLIVRLSSGRELRLVLSIWSSYMPTGIALMLLLSPVLMTLGGWRGLWLANGVAVAIGFAAVLIATRHVPDSPGRGPRPAEGLWRTVSSPGPLVLGACFAAYTFQYLPLVGFLPLLLVEEQGLSQAIASSLTALVVASNVIGTITGGWLLQRGWRRGGLVAGTAIAMGAFAFGIFNLELASSLRYGLAVAYSAIGGIIPGVLIAGTPVHAPSPQLVGATNGMVMQGSQFGQMVGPPVLAALVSMTGGWQVAPWFLVAGALVTLVLGLWIGRLERTPKSVNIADEDQRE